MAGYLLQKREKLSLDSFEGWIEQYLFTEKRYLTETNQIGLQRLIHDLAKSISWIADEHQLNLFGIYYPNDDVLPKYILGNWPNIQQACVTFIHIIKHLTTPRGHVRIRLEKHPFNYGCDLALILETANDAGYVWHYTIPLHYVTQQQRTNSKKKCKIIKYQKRKKS